MVVSKKCDVTFTTPSVSFSISCAVVVVVESPQVPEDDSQQRKRYAWDAHELIKGPPQAEVLTLRDEGRASEP